MFSLHTVFQTCLEVCPGSDGDKSVELDIVVIRRIMYECMKIVFECYKSVSSGKALGRKEKGGTGISVLNFSTHECQCPDITWLQPTVRRVYSTLNENSQIEVASRLYA